MRTLLFKSREELLVALNAGLLPDSTLKRAADWWSDENGLFIAPSQPLERAELAPLLELGTLESDRSVPEGARRAGSWAEILTPIWVGEPDEVSGSVLFTLGNKERLIELMAELLRLGCDEQAVVQTRQGPLLKARHPPYFTLSGALRRGSGLKAFVPTGGEGGVWLEYGYFHPLVRLLKAAPNSLLIAHGDGGLRQVADDGWRELYQLLDLELGGEHQRFEPAVLTRRLRVKLELKRCAARRRPRLWVFDDDPLGELERLARSLPEQAFFALEFAAGSIGERQALLLRARPGHAEPQLSLRARGFCPHPLLPNLFLPDDRALEPPLRRDRLQSVLDVGADRISWLEPTSGTDFDVLTLELGAFHPLEDWVDYVVDGAREELRAWLGRASFSFQPILRADPEPGPALRQRRAREPREHDEPTEPEATPAKPRLKTHRKKAVPAGAAPAVAPAPRRSPLEQRAVELESEFIARCVEEHENELGELNAELRDMYLSLGRTADASLLFARALWQAGEDDEQSLSSAFAEVAAKGKPAEDVLRGLLARKHRSPDDTRAIAALGIWLGHSADLGALATELGAFMNRHGADLDVRTRWLAELALSSISGGDSLRLGRARDAIFGDLRGGLSPERDLPSFLGSFAMGAGDAELAARMKTELEEFYQYVEKTPRQRASVEAPEALTRAYQRLCFAYGFARLGEQQRAAALIASADQALDKKDPIHRFLNDAYAARARQAGAGVPLTAALPAEIVSALNQLPKFARYKVDRLREASGLLEPVERLDAVRGFQSGEVDPRGAALAALRGLPDPVELGQQLGSIVAAACGKKTPIEERARILDGSMDFLVQLPVSSASGLLEEIAGALDEVEPGYRALLLEEALMNAGLLGLDTLVHDLLERLKSVLGELEAGQALGLGRVLEGTLGTLRRVGLRHEARELLDAVAALDTGDEHGNLLMRMSVAGGLAYLGEAPAALGIVDEAFAVLAAGPPMPRRLEITKSAVSALGSVEADLRLPLFRKLAAQLPLITDSFSTNSHFCLSVVDFVESLVLGYAGTDLGHDSPGRRWLDDDEAAVRGRIHGDLRRGRGGAQSKP